MLRYTGVREGLLNVVAFDQRLEVRKPAVRIAKEEAIRPKRRHCSAIRLGPEVEEGAEGSDQGLPMGIPRKQSEGAMIVWECT